MSEWHPREDDLAQISETDSGAQLADHLRWCSQCRGIAAEYAWLEEKIAAGFDAGLKAMPVPPSRWENVYERLRPDHERTVGHRLLAMTGAAVIACMMLVAPSVISRGARAEGVPAPDVVAVRIPVSADDDRAATGGWPSLTRTPGSSVSSEDRTVSLPFVPPPEPPEPEA